MVVVERFPLYIYTYPVYICIYYVCPYLFVSISVGLLTSEASTLLVHQRGTY